MYSIVVISQFNLEGYNLIQNEIYEKLLKVSLPIKFTFCM